MGRDERIKEIETELAELQTQQATLGVELNSLRGKSLDDRMGELFGDSDITLETAMQVDLEECGNRSYGSTWWKMITEFLGSRDELTGLYQRGMNPDAGGQALFSIQLDQNRPLEEQKGLKILLPHVRAVDGWKRFDIFEHSMSANGSWLLRVSEDGEVAEVWGHRHYRYVHTHGSTEAYYKADFIGSVDEALAYIYKTHPYSLPAGSEEEEEEEEEEDEW